MKKLLALVALPLCLAAFAPASSGAPKNGKHKTAVVAHRGFWNCEQAGKAKNSIASLIQAQENGFWGSEFDLNMTSDGQLLVYHDSVIDGKSIEKNPASTFDYYRLANGEKIPTLDEYLDQGAKSRTMLVLELKKHSCKEVEDKAVELVLQKLRDHKLLKKNRVMFISFSINICKEFARLAPGFTVQYLDDDLTPDQILAEGVKGIDSHHAPLRKNGFERLHQARKNGMSVNVWTVNKEADMRPLIEAGVDQITTDNPLLLRDLLGDRELK